MNNTLLTVLVLLVIGIIGWLAYSQGYFQGTKEDADESSLEINFGDSSPE